MKKALKIVFRWRLLCVILPGKGREEVNLRRAETVIAVFPATVFIMAPKPLFQYSMESVLNLDTLQSLELSSFKGFEVNESSPNENNERRCSSAKEPSNRQPSIIGVREEQFRADGSCSSSIPTDTVKDDTDSERYVIYSGRDDIDFEKTIMDDDSDSERTIIDDDSDYERTIIDDDSDSQKSITDEEYRIDENKYRVMLIE